MTHPSWIKLRWLLSSMVIIPSTFSAAQSLPGPASPSTLPSPQTAVEDPLTTLQSADATQGARDIAAIRLIGPRDPAKDPIAVDLLTSGSKETRVAIARAIASVSWASADFVDPLESLLRGRDPAPAGAAAIALGLYRDNPEVMQELIVQAKSDRSEDFREPAIRALAEFSQKGAADALLYLMQHEDPDPSVRDAIREAAGNALLQMTGRSDLDHDSSRWAAWWQQNNQLPDDQFHDAIIRGRGDAFENEITQHRALENAADDFLRSDFWSAPPEKRSAILFSYLQSSAPEIRALGAELVYSSAGSTGTPPAGTIEQTRLLLADPSPEVRAAAARALSTDADSAADLVAQLTREQDDLVRVRLIKSLAPMHDVHAIAQMVKLVGKGASIPVRVSAADGIGEGSDIINSDPQLKAQAIQALKDAMDGTDVPDQQHLREAIVGAMAAMHDSSLVDVFRNLLASQGESPGVRASALVGLGSLPNSTQFAPEILPNLDDNDYHMRLAAIEALQRPPSPVPDSYITKLLSKMNDDGNDQVQAAAWNELKHWADLPDMDEGGLSFLADGLKSQPARELLIRQKLCDRLAQDVQKGTPAASGHPAAQELAEEQQTVGDLLANPPIDKPLDAAIQYRAALQYWKANQGGVDVINRLCGEITGALLAGKSWDEAATFASGIVKQYGKDPDLMVTSQTVATEFIVAVEKLQDSSDPGAYSDAILLLDTVQKMNPPLPPDFADQLASRRAAIEAKHAASSKP